MARQKRKPAAPAKAKTVDQPPKVRTLREMLGLNLESPAPDGIKVVGYLIVDGAPGQPRKVFPRVEMEGLTPDQAMAFVLSEQARLPLLGELADGWRKGGRRTPEDIEEERRLLEMERQGLIDAEIARRLNTSLAAIGKRRSRAGRKKLPPDKPNQDR